MNIAGNNLSEPLINKTPPEVNNTDIDEETSNINSNMKIQKWNSEIENLLKSWGEKSGGLSILHSNDRKFWRHKSNILSITSIIITTLSSSISLSSTSSSYYEVIMYFVGFLGLTSSLIQSLKQFYNADEKASEHRVISKQFGNYFRSIRMQLSLKSSDRVPVNEFTNWAFKEYEKLIQEAPPLNSKTIDEFKLSFKSVLSSKPDVCGDDLIIEINNVNN